ncbi:MAG: PAS domain S-box protein [Pseudomonadota bacterium]
MLELKRKDGKGIWVRINTRVTTNQEGVIFYEGIMEDVSAAKRMEQELRESEGRYRALFERSMDGVYIHDF